MNVLVTGVTGFVGGSVAAALVAAGHRVRGLVRRPGSWAARPPDAVELAGDVTHLASLHRAVDGCDAVLHAAALVKAWSRDRRDFDRVNVEGLGHVVEACRAAGARLFYVSSFIALGPTDGRTFDEATPRAGTDFHNDYERTKWLADQLARRVPPEHVAIVRLYPGVVYGPGALTAGNHVVRLLLDHARGRLPGILGRGDLRQCMAYVEDVALGAVAALERAAPGSAYILGGENRTANELFRAFERAAGVPPPRRRVPFAVASLIGRLQRWRAELTGAEPQITDEVVGIYRHEWAYSSARAEADIGYRITPLERGIERTVEWLRAERHL